MKRIRVITDSASDILPEENPQITVLPMRISFGEETYLDGVTIGHRQFYEKLIESDVLPTTSMIAPAAFEDAFRQATGAGEEVLVVTLSSKLSGTCQSAELAAQSFGDAVRVVDSRSATIGERILIEYALRLAESGQTLGEIAAELERVRERLRLVALLDTLEYLKKGGRISKTVAFVGGMLAIKPVVAIRDGAVELLGKARGSRNGSNFLVKEIERAGGVDFGRPFSLGYAGLDDRMLQKYIQDSVSLWADYTDALPVHTVGATIGTHVGPNAIAVAFFAQGAEG